MKQADEKTFL